MFGSYSASRFIRAAQLAMLCGAALSILSACSPAGDVGNTAPTQITRTQTQSQPKPTRDPASGLPWISRTALPIEGQQMLSLIAKGGPFRYSKDGVVFGNRERILPKQPSGYYHEYTVPTPNSVDRGTRRIVCGSQLQSQSEAQSKTAECYYTADHYNSFARIQTKRAQP